MTNPPTLHLDLKAHLSKIAEYIGPLAIPLNGYIAGGAAVHAYTGDRIFTAVAIEWSHRVAIPPDLAVFEIAARQNPEDTIFVTLEGGRGDYFGSFPPNWKQGAHKICRMGDVVMHVISPLDLAVSKVARLLDRDREDIQALANLNLIAAPEFEAKSMEAIAEYVGDTAFIQRNIRDVLGLINVHEDSNDDNQVLT